MKTANQYFAQIMKVYRDLKGYQSNADDSNYYRVEDLLKTMLRTMLNRDDLLELNKMNLVHLISLCSTYRPREPHSILIAISMAHDQYLKDLELLEELAK